MVTVLGASGFVGSNLLAVLSKTTSEVVYAPARNEDLTGKYLGDVIYCIGLTADFRHKPFNTIESHVCKLKHILENTTFKSFTYLSSTRLYLKSYTSNLKLTEKDHIVLSPDDPYDIFAASKITGELLLLNSGKEFVKVARLSNVFGSDFNSENFITSIVKDAVNTSKVVLQTTPDSEKDYIGIDDVCDALIKLAKLKESGVYNLCSGTNTKNLTILNELARLTGAEISYSENAKKLFFTEIDNSKLVNSIGVFTKNTIVDALPKIVSDYKFIKNS